MAVQYRVFHRYLFLLGHYDDDDFLLESTTATFPIKKKKKKNSIRILKNVTTTTTIRRQSSTSNSSRPYPMSLYHNNDSINNTATETPKWAYAFLVSGCRVMKDEDVDDDHGHGRGGYYVGFLYNIAVAVQRLQDMGSIAAIDFIVFVQLTSDSTAVTLPHAQERLFQQLGNVSIRYLPKMRSSIHETSFYAVVVPEKFRLLQLHLEYDQVLFLDADVLPLCNLDYLLALAATATSTTAAATTSTVSTFSNTKNWKPNIILAQPYEAANAGVFVLSPKAGDWEALQAVIRKKEERALQLPWPHWDEREGWGHVIAPPDYWRGTTKRNNNVTVNDDNDESQKPMYYPWDWHAAFADQGLLYYWTKYVKREVSIIIGDEVEHWTAVEEAAANTTTTGTNDTEQQQQPQLVTLERIDTNSPLKSFSCLKHNNNKVPAPYRDFHHFTGKSKPWEFANLTRPLTKDDYFPTNNNNNGKPLKVGQQLANRINLWRETLLKVQQRTNYSFAILQEPENVGSGGGGDDDGMSTKAAARLPPPSSPSAGRFSTYKAMINHIRAKKFSGWQHYQQPQQEEQEKTIRKSA